VTSGNWVEQVRELALEYGLLCRFTAMIMVDAR
jgi:hypothetical protein